MKNKKEENDVEREIRRIESLTRKSPAHATKLEEQNKQLSEIRERQNKDERKTDLYDGESTRKRFDHKKLYNI